MLSPWEIKVLQLNNEQKEYTVQYQSVCIFCLKYVGLGESHVCMCSHARQQFQLGEN